MKIRIEGTGPVALATALWMVRAGVPARQIALPLEEPAVSILPDEAPRRALALSEGSRQMLARLIDMPPSGRIDTVEIFQAGRSGHTRIQRSDFPLPALGWVIVWEELIAQLHEAARGHALARPEDAGFATPDLRVHAGGMPPPARRNAQDFDVRDSGQAGLLFEVQVTSTQQTAFECFRPCGPLALLPAPAVSGADHGARYTVVWCDTLDASRQRATLTPEALGAELKAALRATLGPRHWHLHAPCFAPLSVVTPAVAVPLPRVARRETVGLGEVWIGNAAQALHPVAGQGLNLGLRDAFTLARCLGDAWARGQTAPLPSGLLVDEALEHYQQARRRDRTLTIQGTDLLAHSFAWPAASRIQSALLGAMHVSPALRMPLARALVFGHR